MMLTSNEWPWEEKNDALLKKMKQNSQNSNIVEDPKIFDPFVLKNNAKKKKKKEKRNRYLIRRKTYFDLILMEITIFMDEVWTAS